jgi:hypothetical protein
VTSQVVSLHHARLQRAARHGNPDAASILALRAARELDPKYPDVDAEALARGARLRAMSPARRWWFFHRHRMANSVQELERFIRPQS